MKYLVEALFNSNLAKLSIVMWKFKLTIQAKKLLHSSEIHSKK
ncbi:hypothetical protein D515_00627 [Grimontia indica]|uniref:Uncharacterized protein n=1 Tax=Grimontia indica TaxID=1056512 RepID=R1GWD4_9GAMM|nr:hypothetical protein D515_00627 [Grimontia indica]